MGALKGIGAIVAGMAVAVVAFGGAPGGCGGGTLGGNGGGNGTGMVTLGSAGRGSGVGGAGAAAGSAPGIGGDIAPPPGGRGGVAGQAGFGTGGRGGGSGDTGGNPGCYMPIPPPVCGSLCGNGTIEGCARAPALGCSTQIVMEQCDGRSFGPDSCQARGYGSGNLSCRSDCTVDPGNCSECVSGPSVIRCGQAPFSSEVASALSLAATDAEIGVAMLTHESYGRGALSFSRLGPDLSALGTTVVDDTTAPGPLEGAYLLNIAAAPLRSGWVVAVCTDRNLYIHVFDANGQDAGWTVVADSSPAGVFACASEFPTVAARPGGEVLLAWQSATGVNATVIAADGKSFTPPRTILTSDVSAYAPMPAAWIGDAFYVAPPVYSAASPTYFALHFMRVQADGTATDIGDHLSGVGFAGFVAGASDIRVVYTGTVPADPAASSGVMWQRLDPNGVELPAVVLGRYPDAYGWAPAVAFGDDTVILLPNAEGNTLRIARLALDGTMVSPGRTILSVPLYSLTAWTMVRRGPDVIVGWIGQGPAAPRVGLARVTP